MAEGRGGVVRKFWTTPPRLHELMRLRDFSLIVQPPLLLLRRGAWEPQNSEPQNHKRAVVRRPAITHEVFQGISNGAMNAPGGF